LASMAHRVAKGLVGGCALLLGVTVTGCAAPQYTYVANSSESTYFKVPHSWHEIGPSSLAAVLRKDTGSSGGGWMVAYEAGSKPDANDFLSFDNTQPFVFAEIGTLDSTASNALSYNSLRDFFLPVTSTDRQQYSSTPGYPLSNFSQIRDQTLTLAQGVHGVRETFDYTYNDGSTDTFDEITLTNADSTVIYFLVLHCTTSCYNDHQAEINDVMSSFTVRSPS
jgi:hypothetical protein